MSAQQVVSSANKIGEKLSQRISQLQADEFLNVSKLTTKGTGAKKIKQEFLPYTRYVLQSTLDGQFYPIVSNNIEGIQLLLTFVPFTDVTSTLIITPNKSPQQHLEEKLASLRDGEVLDVTKINAQGLGTRKMVPPKNTDNWYVAGNYAVISRSISGLEQFANVMQPEYLSVVSFPRTERKNIKDLLLARIAEVPEGKHLDITELQTITEGLAPGEDDILRGTRITTLPYNLNDLYEWKVYVDYPVAYRSYRGSYNNVSTHFAHALGLEPEDLEFYPSDAKLKVKPWSALYNLQRAYEAKSKGKVLDVSKFGQDKNKTPPFGARMIKKPTAEWSTKKYVLDLPVVSNNDDATILFLKQLDEQDPGKNYLQRFLNDIEQGPSSSATASSIGELLSVRTGS